MIKNRIFTRTFFRESAANQIYGNLAIWFLCILVIIFAQAELIWIQIPLMERFALIPWLIFSYTYALCSMYESTHNLERRDRKIRRKNYVYTLWWGLIVVLIHYIYIPYSVEPALLEYRFWQSMRDFHTFINEISATLTPQPLHRIDGLLPWLGLILAFYGSVRAASGRIHLDGYWGVNVYEYAANHKIIETGPYKKVRHPIYQGQTLLVLGTALISGSIIFYIFFALTFALNIRRAWIEEEELHDIFGDQFRQYKRNTYFMLNGIW
jgi:isoprenylcysteine carboxyl methyltransferase (ICMT) family protein YpbQ